MKTYKGIQKDLFGNTVHILNTKDMFRMVKCGKCGNTVKMSQAKTHLTYGKTLTVCNDCLKKEGRVYSEKKIRDDCMKNLPDKVLIRL